MSRLIAWNEVKSRARENRVKRMAERGERHPFLTVETKCPDCCLEAKLEGGADEILPALEYWHSLHPYASCDPELDAQIACGGCHDAENFVGPMLEQMPLLVASHNLHRYCYHPPIPRGVVRKGADPLLRSGYDRHQYCFH